MMPFPSNEQYLYYPSNTRTGRCWVGLWLGFFLCRTPCCDSWSTSSSFLDEGRRSILFRPVKGVIATVAGGVLLTLSTASPTHAAVTTTAGEAIRRGAANLPGYGQSDVFYPSSFQGSWSMTRDVELGGGGGSSSPIRLVYPFRFITSIEDDGVVADRGVNQAELEQALVGYVQSKQKEQRDEGPSSSVVRPSYQWTVTNPNDLQLVFADGSHKDIKVTKRATERTDTTVSSSEFQRLTQDDGGERRIPSISARRVVTKWKLIIDGDNNNTPSRIEGLEIVYNIPIGGDPLAAGGSASGSTTPTVLSKSRMVLQRQ